jgi:hypothetical protein
LNFQRGIAYENTESHFFFSDLEITAFLKKLSSPLHSYRPENAKN